MTKYNPCMDIACGSYNIPSDATASVGILYWASTLKYASGYIIRVNLYTYWQMYIVLYWIMLARQ